MTDRATRNWEADIVFEGSLKSYSHIHIKAQRYGAATARWGESAGYAYTGARNPVKIQSIFHVEQVRDTDDPLIADIALVRQFQWDDDLPTFPWELWYAEPQPLPKLY